MFGYDNRKPGRTWLEANNRGRSEAQFGLRKAALWAFAAIVSGFAFGFATTLLN